MPRRGLIGTILRLLVSESIKNVKRSNSQTRITNSYGSKNPRSDNKHFKTRYKLPIETITLASRGMHAYPVSGESFYLDNFSRLRNLFPGNDEVYTRGFLVPEPKNPWDKNAVAVVIAEYVVGHIPRHTAPIFSEFLSGKVGECGARIYFNSYSGHHSIELDCDFPPRRADEPARPFETLLGGQGEPSYTMEQITTRGSGINLYSWGKPPVEVTQEKPYFGVAVLREGFRDSPELVDDSSLQLIGFPYETISYDFNLFARSYGGEVKVRYKLEVKENGRPKVLLEASVLPKFKTKKYY
jgi:hypothetical protein